MVKKKASNLQGKKRINELIKEKTKAQESQREVI